MTVRKFRQADWEEPLIFELSHEGRYGFHPPEAEEGDQGRGQRRVARPTGHSP